MFKRRGRTGKTRGLLIVPTTPAADFFNSSAAAYLHRLVPVEKSVEKC
ncbi:unnamed protein product [Onchocerca flexuosa]|uniref:Uncharacterized protein n=1 Tax=Onchocerca flexuosa TaxID=387005 RepID=A0A183H8T8_9BILA|nr:unnamed protein product [Onchocerca flexuosa]